MQRFIRLALIMVATLGAAFSTSPALAQSARTASGNAQVMQQLQALAAERTRLLADNAKLQADLEATRKERDALRKQQDATKRRLEGGDVAAARAGARAATLQQELDREKSRLAELVGKFREMAGTLREVETDRTTVKTSLGQRDAELKQCIDRSLSLYQLNGEILTRLEQGGAFTPASVFEPFTRLKRVELENLIDGYQSRAEELRSTPTALQPPPVR
jgi:predicted RNase H-like nuclease (RuvC/YqgF family)